MLSRVYPTWPGVAQQRVLFENESRKREIENRRNPREITIDFVRNAFHQFSTHLVRVMTCSRHLDSAMRSLLFLATKTKKTAYWRKWQSIELHSHLDPRDVEILFLMRSENTRRRWRRHVRYSHCALLVSTGCSETTRGRFVSVRFHD